MIHLAMSLFVAVLFYVLTPGILLSLPSDTESKQTVAMVHALVFGLVFHLTHKTVSDYFYGNEKKQHERNH